MFRLLLAMVIGGGVLAYLGFQEMRLSGVSKPELNKLTCSELIKNGTGDNAHVELTNFIIPPSSYVYETGRGGNSWQTVWLVAVPADGDYAKRLLTMNDDAKPGSDMAPSGNEVRVIIKSSK